jgi:predicted amidohydrolase YtcJ
MHKQLITLAILSTAMCLGANSAQSQASDNDADMILVGGEFYTANPRQPWASAVAVRGDTIVYVGDEAGAADFVGPATSQYQLNDALVIPGIVDAHTHPGLVARSADNLQIADSQTQAELMTAIAAMVESHPQQ